MHRPLDSQETAAERRFFAAMSWVTLAVVFVGFASNYYLWPILGDTHVRPGRPAPQSLPLVVHAHAAAFSLWVVILAVQTALVAKGQVRRHRRLGLGAAGLLPLMLMTGVATAITGARNGWNPGGPYRDALAFMFVGLADLFVFASLTGAGLTLRGRPDIHKRLMLLGTVGGLLWPAITRMPGVAGRPPRMFGILAAVVMAIAARDFLRGTRLRWWSLVLGLTILATFPLRVVIANSGAWRSLAVWLIQ